MHENTRRVLNGRSNKKLGKWQCNYDASNFNVATVRHGQILRADAFRDRLPATFISISLPLFTTVAANRIFLEIYIYI